MTAVHSVVVVVMVVKALTDAEVVVEAPVQVREPLPVVGRALKAPRPLVRENKAVEAEHESVSPRPFVCEG